MDKTTKTRSPKIRFHPGDWFKFEDLCVIIFMYRVQSEPNTWYHVLEDSKEGKRFSENDRLIDAVLSTYQPPERIVHKPFYDHNEAMSHYNKFGCNGTWQTTKSTQELLKLKKVF